MRRAILITARLKSVRLPLKVIREIEGLPMIVHMINRLKISKSVHKIIICTSKLDQDLPLKKIAFENDIDIFFGSADDVLERLLGAAEKYNLDTIINCTADNPFVDPNYIDKLINFHEENNNDFSKIEGLPFGVFSYAIKKEALKKVCEIKQNTDTEVWHGYFMNTGMFKWSSLMVTEDNLYRPEYRLTVDTPEDFRVIEKIFNELYSDNKVFSLDEIIKYLDRNPDILEINQNIKQKIAPNLRIKGENKVYKA